MYKYISRSYRKSIDELISNNVTVKLKDKKKGEKRKMLKIIFFEKRKIP